MHQLIGIGLLIGVVAVAMGPAFPILGIFEKNFPELPEIESFYDVNQISMYILKAISCFVLAAASMVLYTDIVGPTTIRAIASILTKI
ncbi:unnamed protein product [Caenorhabditis bovis]|uniref:Uncharacterized protein n=1 Tax=Caenorhabditis bovis TaxID=2654633 RepID=A0A8S1F7W5_9PELO|nr:unnamed protein product [Caenorhabditis bovis]